MQEQDMTHRCSVGTVHGSQSPCGLGCPQGSELPRGHLAGREGWGWRGLWSEHLRDRA